jgi:hypothetical protein
MAAVLASLDRTAQGGRAALLDRAIRFPETGCSGVSSLACPFFGGLASRELNWQLPRRDGIHLFGIRYWLDVPS